MAVYEQAFALIDFAEKSILYSGKRVQVYRSKLPQLRETVLKAYSKLPPDSVSSSLIMSVNDFMEAVDAVNSTQYDVIPEGMKRTLESGLMTIKQAVAELCFDYYRDHDIPLSPEMIELMREVVALTIGGK